jgi:hypothetical protein
MSHGNTSIILYGRYEPKPFNMEKIVRGLAEIPIGTDTALAPSQRLQQATHD